MNYRVGTGEGQYKWGREGEKTSINKKKTKSALKIISKLNKLSIYDLTCMCVKVYACKCKKDKSAFIFKAAQYWLSDHTSIHL